MKKGSPSVGQYVNIAIVSYCIGYTFVCCILECMEDGIMLGTVIAATVGAASTVVSAIIAARTKEKSQIKANTEMLEEMARQIGLSDDISLRRELHVQFQKISDSMGVQKNDERSLTAQHSGMMHAYAEIKERLDKKDEAYRRFTKEQRDLKETLDNFSVDYMEMAAEKEKMITENENLKSEIEQLLRKLEDREKQIAVLKQRENNGRSGR